MGGCRARDSVLVADVIVADVIVADVIVADVIVADVMCWQMCGPTGIGFLYGRQEILRRMPPWRGGYPPPPAAPTPSPEPWGF